MNTRIDRNKRSDVGPLEIPVVSIYAAENKTRSHDGECRLKMSYKGSCSKGTKGCIKDIIDFLSDND